MNFLRKHFLNLLILLMAIVEVVLLLMVPEFKTSRISDVLALVIILLAIVNYAIKRRDS